MSTKRWFSIDKIDNQTFVISEKKHWEETNCYLLIGDEKAVLIDTGLGVANMRDVVEKLTDKEVFVLTTHVHWDHIGSHALFDYFGVHELEKTWINGHFPLPLDVVKKNLGQGNTQFPDGFDVNAYQIFEGEPNFTYQDGDEIDLGNRKIKVIHTPGHSPGHCCFYEKGKYLYTGDLVYEGKLDAYYPTTDSFDFLNSIKKIQNLDFKRVLPGHYDFNLDREIVDDIYQAFLDLEKENILGIKNGIYDFGDFSIHI